MPSWIEVLTSEELERIHAISMKVLSQVGVEFLADEAVSIMRRNGAKVEGQKVFLTEEQVLSALSGVPSQFTLHARNPHKDVTVGGGNAVFVPGYGAPFLADPDLGTRKPTKEDYDKIVQLCHVLPNQDLTGYLMVQPDDLPPESAHLHMLHSTMILSDKPFIGCSEGRRGAVHTMEMAEILFDERPTGLAEKPFTMGVINTLSPLRFGRDMALALVEYARWRQPVLIAAAAMAGSTAPITLAGLLAQQNAEILAGIVLAQWTSAGTPVVYGSTSTNMDMKTGAMVIGSPELSLVVVATAQLARRYGLPCRSGGALSDSHSPDIRAGYESALGLSTACRAGVDFILHAAGILSTFLSFSCEKLVLDDELCGMVRRTLHGIEVNTETLCYDSIAAVGPGGNYLGEPLTVNRCRVEFWVPTVFKQQGLSDWLGTEARDVIRRARERCETLLESYQAPLIDDIALRQLQAYMTRHAV